VALISAQPGLPRSLRRLLRRRLRAPFTQQEPYQCPETSADYEVFARGYGLVDSPRVSARPGRTLNVDAVVAPDARAASAVYPAASWLSLMEIPPGELPAEDVTRRVNPDPPAMCKAEVYEVPEGGRDARGNGIDSEGVVWVNDRFTDRVIGFDRRKCAVLSGPTATGSHCPEGWTVHRKADQTFRGSDLNADLNYLITVDTYGTAGLGTDIPVTYAVNSGALLALLPDSDEWVTLRVPYPLG